MIVCTSCGTQNEDGESFCGTCGGYLEWDGERVGEPAQPAPPSPAPEPQPADGPGLLRRVRQAVGIGERPGGPDAPPPPGGPPPGGSPPGEPRYTGPAAAPQPIGGWSAPPAQPSFPSAGPPAHPQPPAQPSWAPPPGAGPVAPLPAPPPPARGSALVVPLGAAPADAVPAAARAAASTVPASTVPASTVPASTAPASTVPASTVPASTAPAPLPTDVPPAQPSSAPAAVRPGQAAPKPRRRELPPQDRPPAPGETICGSCGAGNAPARRFCRRCGASLADMPVAAKLPWWRRAFTRREPAPVAGDRPRVRRRRSHGKLWTTLSVVVVLVIAGYLTRPYWSPALGEVIDRVQGTKELNPNAFAASSSALPDHPAALVHDGATNNYWAPAVPASKAAGQWVKVGFASPFRLVYLRVFNGASADHEAFLAAPSLQQISVTYFRKGSSPIERAYTLQDKEGAQQLHVAIDDVVAIQVTIHSVYRPASGPLAPLGELEFLARG